MGAKGALRNTKGSNPYIAMGLEPLIVVARDGIEPPTRGFSVVCRPLYSRGWQVLVVKMLLLLQIQ